MMRITKAQLERTDFFLLVLGALFNIANKKANSLKTGMGSSYDYAYAEFKSNCSLFSKVLQAWDSIRGGYSLFSDIIGLEKIANSFDIRENIKKIIEFTKFDETIEAPEFVKADYGYEYVKDLINFQFYDKI